MKHGHFIGVYLRKDYAIIEEMRKNQTTTVIDSKGDSRQSVPSRSSIIDTLLRRGLEAV